MQEKPASSAARLLDGERAQAQLELKNRALAASAEGITIADATLPDNPLIYVNAGFERLTGYAAADVLGRNCRFLQGPGTDPETVAALRTALREKRALTVQLLNYHKDGKPFWNRLAITPVEDASGRVTHFIGVQSDVTAEKEATDALQAASLALKKDLLAAAELQHDLLPAALPAFPGLGFAFRFRPCSDVGGDSLNVFALDDRYVALYILDVSGHGVAAALLSVTLTHMLSFVPDRSFLFQPEADGKRYCIAPPADVVARLNRHFVAASGSSRFFTMVYGILDRCTGEFRYVAAGHLGPIRVSPDRPPEILDTGGIPVGLLAGAEYSESVTTLRSGDRLYFCTDGVTEAANEAEESFGVGRLLEMLDAARGAALGDTLSSVMDRVERWSGAAGAADDASMLAVERTVDCEAAEPF